MMVIQPKKIRSIIQKLCFFLLFAGITDQINSQELGLQLYSLRDQFKQDVPGTLQIIRDWGIEKIEGGENTYGLEQREFIGLLHKNKLDVVSVGAKYKELIDDLDKVAERAKAFGATYVMCPWIPHEGKLFSLADANKAIRVFNEAGKSLDEHGIRLVYHIHGYEFVPYKQGTLFDVMVQNSEHFDFEMDVFWVVHGGEDPLRLLRSYAGRFPLLHLKDMEPGLKGDLTGHAEKDTNVALGMGQINIREIVEEAQRQQVQHMFIEDESPKVLEQIPESLEYLDQVLGRKR